MSDKVIAIEETEGTFQMALQRVMRMVPDRDRHDKKLQRLIAFRLKLDGEASLSEYLIRKIRDAIKCSYSGSLYDFLKDDLKPGEHFIVSDLAAPVEGMMLRMDASTPEMKRGLPAEKNPQATGVPKE